MISTCINATTNLVTHTGNGEISACEIRAAFKARIDDPKYRSGMRVLWDFRSATISQLRTEELRELVVLNRLHVRERGSGMAAIVVTKDADYGVCRMFMFLSDDLPWRTVICRDVETAMLCLNCES